MMHKHRRDPAHPSDRRVANVPLRAPWRLLPRVFASCTGEDYVTLALFLIAAIYMLFSERFWNCLPFCQ
jgi:hypothetical protein